MKTFKKVIFGLTLIIFCLANISMLNMAFADRQEPSTQGERPTYRETSEEADLSSVAVEHSSERRNNGSNQQNSTNNSSSQQNSTNNSVYYDQSTSPYDSVLNDTIKDKSLYSALVWKDVVRGQWSQMFNSQVLVLIGYAIDIFIAIWIAIAFFGWYKIMTSSKEETLKEWIRIAGFGILWVIIMVSAKFISNWLVWENGIITNEFVSITGESNPNWIQFANNLYQTILYPFIKVALYLVIWFLFFVMAAKVISFVVSTDDSAKKKAGWIIIWCVVWILIVMWSKQMVEAIMWKQEDVINTSATKIDWWVWWIGEEVLNFQSIPLISQVINWVMWLTMLIVLILIIIQAYRMFAQPDDPKNRERLKKTLLYVIIWVLVIWASYLISNVLIINRLPWAS